MRTDAIIDRRQVRCPKASTLGYGKWKAQVGDLVLFTEGQQTRTGRMIGRIHYAPACGESPIIRDYLLVVCLNDSLDHTFERWVNPADVQRVEALREQQPVMAYFLSADLVKSPIDEVRRSTTDGWTTLAKYRAYMAERAAQDAAFERRHPKGVCQCKLCVTEPKTAQETK